MKNSTTVGGLGVYLCRHIPVAKLKKVMRFSLIICLSVVVTAQVLNASSLKGQNLESTEIKISLKDESLTNVFQQIEQHTVFKFMYRKQDVKNITALNLKETKTTVGKLLHQLLTPNGLAFKQVDNRILITPVKEVSQAGNPEVSLYNKAATAIKGKVTDVKGDDLPGVSILIKGSQHGTVTDANGNYTLEITEEEKSSAAAALIFSFVGYVPQEIAIGNKSVLDVILAADTKNLEELVVVGYGTQKKTSVTAAISSMSGSDVASTPITNLSNGLGGRLSGVIFRQGSGEPGKDASSIFIRGVATTGNNQPLFIVDNIPRSFQDLDPNSIETITVLKDAAAVAPYGVAGANGVILVTTKRGKSGSPTLSYNGYVGFQNPTVLTKYPNSYEYASLLNAASKNDGLPAKYSDAQLQKFKDGSDPANYPNNNPWDLINKNNTLTSHNIEVSGGTDLVKYYGSIGYQYEAGLFGSTYQHRYNLNLNLDAQVTKTTKISLGIKGREQNNHYPSATTDRMFITITNANPTWIQVYPNGLTGNLLSGLIKSDGYRKTNTSQIFSQLSIDQDLNFVPGLKARGSVAYDPTNTLNKNWLTPISIWALDPVTSQYNLSYGERSKSELSQSYTRASQITFQASLIYNRSFKKHNVGLLALFESKGNDELSFSATRRNFGLSIDELNMGSSSQADISNTGSSIKARQLGLVYRAQYDYDSKYLFEASGRYDGSYYFAPGKKFGFFPAFSVGWRLSEENFIKQNLNWINNLKIRASYGEVGALAGSAFQYLSTYSVYGPAYVIGGNAVQGTREKAESNPNITWERAKKTDVGIEASLWKGLITLEADYFHEKRSNMLTSPDLTVPSEYGIGLSQVNAGIMVNHGIDLSIGTARTINKDLKLSLTANFTYAKNSLLKVFETSSTYDNPNRRRTNRPLGTQFGYKSLGLFQVKDFDESGNLKSGVATQPWGKIQAGDIRYQDMDGDGKITTNDETVIGNADTPQIVYGIMPNVTYKNVTLNLLFQGAAKTNFYTSSYAAWAFYGGTVPVRQNLDYWTPENTDAKNPRITSAPTTNNTQVSSFWMNNSSYLRLKSAMLSYMVPSKILDKIHVQNAKVFVSGQNLLTWTKIVNYDPENVVSSGLNYPQQKVISLGMNLTF
ncbi:SusC/RagA family TonB-linked outer membrane protein [Dyadobacter frigoris]|uniref:TonB-dependent receptor n=1 Tax=Dyadobacter frigoris TaxID=2576211 RepID=A0A4U6CZU9_9BACT|nr:TonB-dependent receptor [Dyadobacter frigoris]TKT86994.1 TonB-dependent receptor [Dyadobacter frigoris]GLU52813.1 SusC/RagA family TonB-linked outer membrane protein [Dyadobacter frigoris]